jgi:hypothetical protein
MNILRETAKTIFVLFTYPFERRKYRESESGLRLIKLREDPHNVEAPTKTVQKYWTTHCFNLKSNKNNLNIQYKTRVYIHLLEVTIARKVLPRPALYKHVKHIALLAEK